MNLGVRLTEYERAVLDCQAARRAVPYSLTEHDKAGRRLALARSWFVCRIQKLEATTRVLRLALARQELSPSERTQRRGAVP